VVANLGAGSVDSQVNQAVRVSPFVIIPGNDLVEVVVEEDAGTSIDSGRSWIVNEITRDNGIFGVSEDSLHVTFGGFLEGGEDFFLGSGLLGSEGQIDDGNIGSGDLRLYGVKIVECINFGRCLSMDLQYIKERLQNLIRKTQKTKLSLYLYLHGWPYRSIFR